MALTYTPSAELGAPCPNFSLPTVDGKQVQLSDFLDAKVLVVAFICNHCPYVKAIEDRLLTLGRHYQNEVRFLAICSNDPADYPEDSAPELKKRWVEKKYPFPYAIDETQDTARAFGAVCTPDFFVYDSKQKLAYRGRLDDSWKNPVHVKRQELREAIEELLQNRPLQSMQNPAMGCSIKWKKDS